MDVTTAIVTIVVALIVAVPGIYAGVRAKDAADKATKASAATGENRQAINNLTITLDGTLHEYMAKAEAVGFAKGVASERQIGSDRAVIVATAQTATDVAAAEARDPKEAT